MSAVVVTESKSEVVVKGEPVSWQGEFKPGQKNPTPAPGNGDRVFYETLYQQRPDSEMAQEWCVAYGVLDAAEATKVYEKLCKRKGKPMVSYSSSNNLSQASSGGTPVKKQPASNAGTPKEEQKKKVRKVIADDDDVEADTGFESGDVWEGQGATGI